MNSENRNLRLFIAKIISQIYINIIHRCESSICRK